MERIRKKSIPPWGESETAEPDSSVKVNASLAPTEIFLQVFIIIIAMHMTSCYKRKHF